MKRLTIGRDPIESPVNPSTLTEEEYQRCSKLLTWRISPRTGKVELLRRTPHVVGRVSAAGHVFSVVPELKPRDFIDYLLYALDDDFRRFFQQLPTAIWSRVAPEDAEFAELLSYLMVAFAERLLNGYLAKTYEAKREIVQTIRGRPYWPANFGRHFATGIVCDYREISTDNLFNRLVLCGLEAAKSILRRRPDNLEALLYAFRSAATEFAADQKAFVQAEKKINRMTEPYRPALVVARSLLFGFSAEDILEGGNSSLQCMQFDMSILFEKFLGKLLNAYFQGTDVRVIEQEDDGDAVLDGYEQTYMRIRPDVIFARNGRAIAVADAKFKSRYVSEPWSKVSSEDIYQMFLYANRAISKYELERDDIQVVIFAPKFGQDNVQQDERALTIRWNRHGERRLMMRIIPVELSNVLPVLRTGGTAKEAVARSTALGRFLENLAA